MNFSQLEESLERNHRTLCHIIQACGLWQHLGTVGAALRIFPSLRHRMCVPGTPQHASVAAEISNFGANAVVLLQNLLCFGLEDHQLALLGRACELLVADVAALYASFMATGSPGPACPSSGSPQVGIIGGPRVQVPPHPNQWQDPGPSRLPAQAEPPTQAPIPMPQAAALTSNNPPPTGDTAAPAVNDGGQPVEPLMTAEEFQELLSDPWVMDLLAMSSTSVPGVPPSDGIVYGQPSTCPVAAVRPSLRGHPAPAPSGPPEHAGAGCNRRAEEISDSEPLPFSGQLAVPPSGGRYRLIPPPPAQAGPWGPRYPLHLQRGQPASSIRPEVPEAKPHIANPADTVPRTPPRPSSSTPYATLSRFRVPSAAVGVGESPRYRPLPAGYWSPKREGKDKEKGKGKERA